MKALEATECGRSRADAAYELRGSVAIVTGGSGGIGLAICRSLAQRGCRVVIAARNAERVRAAAASIEGAWGFPDCDVCSATSVSALFQWTLERFGRFDVLVTCAGIGRSSRSTRPIPDPVATLAVEAWDEVVQTNLLGAFLTNREAARILIARGEGQILNVSSARGARRGYPYGAGYCSAKHGLNAMTQSLAGELEPLGVRVQCLLPDAVDTSLISHTRLGRDGTMTPRTVGEFVAWMLENPAPCAVDEPILMPFHAAQRRRKI